MLPPNTQTGLMDTKKKTHMYDGYKRFTSDLGTDAD